MMCSAKVHFPFCIEMTFVSYLVPNLISSRLVVLTALLNIHCKKLASLRSKYVFLFVPTWKLLALNIYPFPFEWCCVVKTVWYNTMFLRCRSVWDCDTSFTVCSSLDPLHTYTDTHIDRTYRNDFIHWKQYVNIKSYMLLVQTKRNGKTAFPEENVSIWKSFKKQLLKGLLGRESILK